jgi:hypothetical protein
MSGWAENRELLLEETTKMQADSQYDPDTHPAVQAALVAYRRAHVTAELEASMNTTPGTLDSYVAYDTEYRLYLAHRAYQDARLTANRKANPELYIEGTGPDVWTIDDWRAQYPDLRLASESEPTPVEPDPDPEAEAE